jgi:hypothetical protein
MINTALNKENVAGEPLALQKNCEKPREFGRDVTNNAFAEVNLVMGKESSVSTDAESQLKEPVENTAKRDAIGNQAHESLIAQKFDNVEANIVVK